MKLRYFFPLAAHVVPTIVIGFGSVIPGSCIDGMNALTIGFAASVVGTCVAYTAGVWTALRDRAHML
jgi:hypothetical protein